MKLSIKKRFFFALCTVLSLCATAQTGNKTISIGHIDTLHSDILKEDRTLWIYVPEGPPAEMFTQERYPVVYLLDGEANFSSVVGMIQQQSMTNGNDKCPKMIVVGIVNTDRMRDLSPTHVNSGPYITSEMVKNTGGGEQFIGFIENELMPYIQSNYPTESYRMLIGHSLGGLLAIHTLVHHPRLFNAYISIDPSMWWDNRNLLKEAEKILAEKQFDGKSLYLGIANTMDSKEPLKKILKDKGADSEHIRAIAALGKVLTTNQQNRLKYKSKYYNEDTHGSVPLITTYDALRFIFDFYPSGLTRKDYQDNTPALADKILKVAATRSKHMGYSVKPPEELLNRLGYQALNNKNYALAARLFKLNLDYYSKSANVYDSYAEYFHTVGDTTNAIFYYKKALELNPDNANALQILESLGEKNVIAALKLNEPPAETGDFKPADLVELIRLDPTLKLDVRYATPHNFTKRAVYTEARVFLQRPAAEAVVAVHRELQALGYGLLLFDGYRPWSVTKLFWDITPAKDRMFVANPRKGSKHNRGCAIDLSLYELATGKEVQMPGAYDEFSERSFPSYPGGTEKQRQLRDLLRSKMEAHGFTVDGNEWWHFDLNDWRSYRIQNVGFSEIK